jgi:chemotaxis protein MotB
MEKTARNMDADDEQSNGRYRWLTTFNDMITLLMVFFVFIYAMSNPDTEHFENFQNALQSAMGVLQPGQHAPTGIISDGDNNIDPADHQVALSEEGEDDINQLKSTQGLEAQYTKKGIHLTLNDNLLFNSGAARLTPQGHTLLDKVASIIGPLGRYIRVEGHTDNIPILTHRYPSNWELSTARAISVVKYLQSRGIPGHYLSAAGYGESKPRAANDTAHSRSKNRRVEIILQQKAPSYAVK